jgi:hypothetical protein
MSRQIKQFLNKHVSKQLGGAIDSILPMITNGDNLIIAVLVIYISMVSMYTPRALINLVNQPLIKIVVLGIILYTATYNITLAIFIAIALIVTVSIDNSIIASKAIITREKFTGSSEESDENFDGDSEETNGDEGFDGEEDFEDSEEFEANIANNKDINDTFKNLHNAIHKLETFIADKKK